MTAAFVAAALCALAAVVFVAWPFLREPEAAADRLDDLSEHERAQLALAEERDRTIAALKELEFDHRTGKISDDDYRALVGPLRRRAAETLRRAGAARGQERERVTLVDKRVELRR